MRIVADTNTIISGLLWHGPPRRVLDAARTGAITLYTSDALLAELRGVLGRSKFARVLAQNNTTADTLATEWSALVTIVAPATLPPTIIADPDDDEVLACAVAAQAQAIVTGDDHLLQLRRYQSIPILTAPELLALVNSLAEENS